MHLINFSSTRQLDAKRTVNCLLLLGNAREKAHIRNLKAIYINFYVTTTRRRASERYTTITDGTTAQEEILRLCAQPCGKTSGTTRPPTFSSWETPGFASVKELGNLRGLRPHGDDEVGDR